MDFHERSRQNTPLLPLKEIDYRAMRLMMDRSDGPESVKKRHIRKFDRAWRRGELSYAKEETDISRWQRCEARFVLGDYSDWSGWQYRDRWAEKIWFRNPYTVPVWKVEPVELLYVIGEQGLGDEILLSQCIQDAKRYAQRVVFETQGRLQSIFERSLGVKTVKAIVGADLIRRAQPFEGSAWVSLGDMPRVFRRKPEDFPRKPYIYPDAERLKDVLRYSGRVGISWRGAQGRVDWRKMKAMYPNCLSLQYDQSADEEVERPHIDLKDDVEGVLALANVLEKVVTVSTTVAHLAASSGVTTEVMIANHKTGIRRNILPWRWLDLSCGRVPRRARWYGDHVSVYQSWGEYVAYHD